ncbi:MAG: hypothetical protein ACRBFS_18855 [Aureispira sp.]
MILSSIKPVAEWSNITDQEPIDFIYQNNNNCLVTLPNSFLILEANKVIKKHPLETIQELVQLHPWGEKYFLLEFDQTSYNNIAYQIDHLTSPSKQLLENLEDPKNIAYNPLKNLLYYKHSSVRLYMYDLKSKTSVAVFPEKEVSNLSISDNGQYLALENFKSITIVNTQNHEIVYEYVKVPGKYYDLMGVTDSGALLAIHHPVARKNEKKTDPATVFLLQEKGHQPLVETSDGWAKWNQGHLMVLDQKTFKLYDKTILE